MISRRLADLDETVRMAAILAIADCESAGVDILVTCTYRDLDEQARLYAQGRTAPGRIVTWAKPGQSKHNRTIAGKPASLALDFVPMVAGKCCWDAKDPLWKIAADCFKNRGFTWGGDWKAGKRELPHVEMKIDEI